MREAAIDHSVSQVNICKCRVNKLNNRLHKNDRCHLISVSQWASLTFMRWSFNAACN